MSKIKATTLPDIPVEALLFFVGVQRLSICGQLGCTRQVGQSNVRFPEMVHQAVMQGHKPDMTIKFNSMPRRNCVRGDFGDRRY